MTAYDIKYASEDLHNRVETRLAGFQPSPWSKLFREIEKVAFRPKKTAPIRGRDVPLYEVQATDLRNVGTAINSLGPLDAPSAGSLEMDTAVINATKEQGGWPKGHKEVVKAICRYLHSSLREERIAQKLQEFGQPSPDPTHVGQVQHQVPGANDDDRDDENEHEESIISSPEEMVPQRRTYGWTKSRIPQADEENMEGDDDNDDLLPEPLPSRLYMRSKKSCVVQESSDHEGHGEMSPRLGLDDDPNVKIIIPDEDDFDEYDFDEDDDVSVTPGGGGGVQDYGDRFESIASSLSRPASLLTDRRRRLNTGTPAHDHLVSNMVDDGRGFSHGDSPTRVASSMNPDVEVEEEEIAEFPLPPSSVVWGNNLEAVPLENLTQVRARPLSPHPAARINFSEMLNGGADLMDTGHPGKSRTRFSYL